MRRRESRSRRTPGTRDSANRWLRSHRLTGRGSASARCTNASRCRQTRSDRYSAAPRTASSPPTDRRSEEHTSELQSRLHLVCRLLLEKKNPAVTTLTPRHRTPSCSSYPPHPFGSSLTPRRPTYPLLPMYLLPLLACCCTLIVYTRMRS